MKPATYSCPLPGGGTSSELVLSFDAGREHRVLIIPALFDEANKLRHLVVETMRRLDAAGIDCFLPDLPGTNESTLELAPLSLEDWALAIGAATRELAVTHTLALRGGGLISPSSVPGWIYGPVKGASVLRTLLRARVLTAREAGREETPDGLLSLAAQNGIELAGYRLGEEMVSQLQKAVCEERANLTVLDQDTIGGSPLWLRAEPDFDPEQADALAAVVTVALAQ